MLPGQSHSSRAARTSSLVSLPRCPFDAPGDGGFDFGTLVEQLFADVFVAADFGFTGGWIDGLGGHTALQAAGFSPHPQRHVQQRFDGRVLHGFVGEMQIFGQDVGELSLPAGDDEAKGSQADGRTVATARLADGVRQQPDVLQHPRCQPV